MTTHHRPNPNARGHRLVLEDLEAEIKRAMLPDSDFPPAKWLLFSHYLVSRGLAVWLKRSQSTVTKYLTIELPGVKARPFRVRFSNHPPREDRLDDCDFFVGHSQKGITTTADALKALRRCYAKARLLGQWKQIRADLTDALARCEAGGNDGADVWEVTELDRERERLVLEYARLRGWREGALHG